MDWEDELKKKFYPYLDTDTFELLVAFIKAITHSQQVKLVEKIEKRKLKLPPFGSYNNALDTAIEIIKESVDD
jgi:hypothetical protein